MEKFQRNERIAYITKLLTESPGKIFTLNGFMEILGAAKTTISEDIDILRNMLKKLNIGKIDSVQGAAGGVVYIPSYGKDKIVQILKDLIIELEVQDRILPGGFLYILDIIYNPTYANIIGSIFADKFYNRNVDCVITVETKGIPIAYATATKLSVPLVIVRHNNEVTDGASVNINYLSGSSKQIQKMALSIKSLKRNSKMLFIDDFMKGGGTAKGILEIVKAFDSEIVGIGAFIDTGVPEKKLVNDFFSLLTLKSVDEYTGKIMIEISEKIQ